MPALALAVIAWAVAAVSSASPYNDAVLGSGPKYYWTFDEDGVADALEQVSGNEADVFRPSAESAKAPSTSTPGGISLGQALALDRSLTSVWDTGNLSGPAFTGAFAYEVWINSADPDQYNYILGSNAGNGFNTASILQYSNFAPDAGTPHIFVYPAWPGETATALQSAGWHHWVFVNKPAGGGSDVYKNGVFLGAFQEGLSINAFPATELRAGGWSPTPQPENFTGLIDELAIYNLAGLDAAGLTAKGQEIANHYNAVAGIPTIDTQPESQSVSPGANVTFTVVASGGALTYQWEKFGAGWESIAGAASASLVLNAVTAANAGQYRVRVTNAVGPNNSLPATLDLIPPPTAYNNAVLASNPAYYWTFDEEGLANAREQVNGNTADVFEPSAESAKAPSTSIPGGVSLGQALALDNTVTSVWNTDDLSGPGFTGAWAVEVWINSADPQAYQYIVGSQAERGFNTGTIAQLSNFEDDFGNPHIILFTLHSAPSSFNSDSAPQSDGWHHWVFVTKTPAQGTDVYRDGALLGTFGSVSMIDPFPARELRAGGWSPTPSAENFTGLIDELAYYDLADLDEAALAAKGQEIANHSNNAVAGVPTIDTQPQNQSVNPGANVTFTVVASGGALTYQWEKFGAGWEPIAGATSASLVLNAVTAANAGQYRVRVTNAVGPNNSRAATLDLIPPRTAYNNAVRASEPAYYWTFDEDGLANAKEQVNGNAADVFRPSAESARAPSTSTPGGTSLGQALALDRTLTSVWNTGDLSGPGFTGAWAYEVWINSADPDQYNYILGSQAEGGFNNGSIHQFSNFDPDAGTPHIFVYPAWPGDTATALQSAGWHHWVFVNKPDGGGSEVYQNGVFLGAFQEGLSLNIFPARELRAGGWSPTPQPENFTGLIDELAIYDLAGLDAAGLTAKGREIASHYQVGNTAAPLQFTNVFRNPADGQLTLTWTSQPGKTYRLNSSTDLVDFNTVIADNIQSGGMSTTYGPFASPLPTVFFKASEK